MGEYNDTLAFGISVTLENDREHKEALNKAVAERIRDGLGYPNANPDTYREILAHDGARNVAWDVRDVVSDYVLTEVSRRMGDPTGQFLPDDTIGLLIGGMFDLGNADLWADIASRFVPETPEDYAETLGWSEATEGGWFTPGDCQHCGLRSGH